MRILNINVKDNRMLECPCLSDDVIKSLDFIYFFFLSVSLANSEVFSEDRNTEGIESIQAYQINGLLTSACLEKTLLFAGAIRCDTSSP